MISYKRKLNHSSSPDMTPLLDVIFILLIFFVISSIFTTKGMEIDLPPAESAKQITGRSVEIELRANGDLFYNTAPTTFHEISHTLKLLSEKPVSLQPEHIILKSEPEAKVNNFMQLVDMIRTKGFENLIIATSNKNASDSAEGSL